MSRVGKYPVAVPDGVEVRIAGQEILAKGKLGERSLTLVPDVAVSLEDKRLVVKPAHDGRQARNMWGTARSLLRNLVQGVSQGFTRTLEISGVGFRAAISGQTLTLQLGYSHEIKYPVPPGITITCERPTVITIRGADSQRVGQVAAEIRALRRPEPYKGKGIKYQAETIRRKEGKKK